MEKNNNIRRFGQKFERQNTPKNEVQSVIKQTQLIELLKDVPGVVFQINNTGALTYISPQIEEIFGYSPDQVIGRQLFDFLKEEDREPLKAAFYHKIEGEETLTKIDFRVVDNKGEMHSIQALTNKHIDNITGLSYLTGHMEDTTERVTFERELHESTMLKIAAAQNDSIVAWATINDIREHETPDHSSHAAELTLRLAKDYIAKYPDSESELDSITIYRGAMLHDIGKLAIPDNILYKFGKLTDEEYTIMKTHPTLAFNVLSGISFMKDSLDIPLYHHEKWDGTGYPKGLKGSHIPLSARLFSVVDVYSALVTHRGYRDRDFTKEEALGIIKDLSGKSFDPQVVDVFVKTMKNID